MNTDKIKTLLIGMASINRMLAQETIGDGLFEAVTDRMSDSLIMAATALGYARRATDDTEEFAALVVSNDPGDTKEVERVVLYDANGLEVAS